MHMTRSALITPLLLFILVLPPALATMRTSDLEGLWQDYERLLERHVAPGHRHGVALNLVDYPALRHDHTFDRLIDRLAQTDGWHLTDRRQRLAFFINAYNILAMKMVRDHWPIASIKDAGGLFSPVWNRPAGLIGGREVTLDEIEQEVLRRLGEPRIHFAIVCASVSCPDLRREPYVAARLDEQLDDQTRGFLANRGKGLRQAGRTLYISKIFHWFEEDFAANAGSPLDFIRRYRPELPIQAEIEFIDYDWSVNGLPE